MSVVVPTWNRAGLLPKCLDSLVNQTRPAGGFEVIVVDDGSEDDTAAVVQGLARDQRDGVLRYVGQENGGVNRARNAGIRAARGDVVAFIDDDEIAPGDYLERAFALLSSHPSVAGVGGPVLDYEVGGPRTCSQCSLATVHLPHSGTTVTDRLLGGNMVIRRTAFESVGEFADALSGRGDDTEWFRRAGLDFLYEPSLFVWHRRDVFSAMDVIRTQFRQGRALPRAAVLMGERFRPRLGRAGHYLGHGVMRRCTRGLAVAAREAGATLSWLGLWMEQRRRPSVQR